MGLGWLNLYKSIKHLMSTKQIVEYKLTQGLRVIYIISFNVYSWYWLYKLWNNESSWEEWANWFFVTCGVHFFVIDYSKFWSKNVTKVADVFNPEIE